jgi:lipopolysaccharide export system protein LptA
VRIRTALPVLLALAWVLPGHAADTKHPATPAAAKHTAAKPAPPPPPPPPPPPADTGQTRDEGTIEVTADHDLELLQQDHAYVARGNAVAKRGAVTLMGDTLVAYYRPVVTPGAPAKPAAATPAKPGQSAQSGMDTSNTEIWRIVADGNVHLLSNDKDAWGDHAEYDKDKSVFVLTGKALKGSDLLQVVTARDSLEYWDDMKLAVARGNALIVKVNGNTLAGDVVAGHFVKNDKGEDELKTISAKGHVVVTTLSDVVHGDEGTYDADNDRTVLFGNVKATRGDSEIEGQSAAVDMKSGISQVFPGPGQQVTGVFVRQNATPSSDSNQAKPSDKH